ncbi:MAG: folate-binding protein YgfZ [Alphaproteobacteria bacterium]|nr:folate-binding protein YgfZ [Alphaproteobacteria bacterium]
MAVIYRLDRAVVHIFGADAERLLNDTLTAGIKSSSGGTGGWFALLSPQGKVLVEGLVVAVEGSFWFDLPPAGADEFIKRIGLYRLRADVTIKDWRNSHVTGWSEHPIDAGLAYADGRHGSLGFRTIVPQDKALGWQTDSGQFGTRLAEAGIVELGTGFVGGAQFAHDIGLDERGGIDFEKGCYIGQEIVSRMRHRGTARKRPVILTADAPIPAGTKVTSNGVVVGTVFAGGATKTVALLRIDRITPDSKAKAGDQPVGLSLPDWASYRFSESGHTG